MKIINITKSNKFINTPKLENECIYKCKKHHRTLDNLIQDIIKHEEEYDTFFEKFKNEYDQYHLLKNLNYQDINNYSFINFLRYYTHLVDFLRYNRYSTMVCSDTLSIIFESKKELSVSLQLTFQSDGCVRFLSLDKDHPKKDEVGNYSIEGYFSSSSSIYKNYKIKRLLSIISQPSISPMLFPLSFDHISMNTKSLIPLNHIHETPKNFIKLPKIHNE